MATWGLLAVEELSLQRRTRSLGLNRSVRQFNELAVPGLGGIWYAKQLVLPLLGIVVAEQARQQGQNVTNIQVANSIEAVGCLFAFLENKWQTDLRLRGNTKLAGVDDNLVFSRVKQPSFYVTQPMRMASVLALPALDLVDTDSARFNAFQCNESGKTLIQSAFRDYKPSNSSVTDYLVKWLNGGNLSKNSIITKAISPIIPLDKATLNLIKNSLIKGNDSNQQAKRRANALKLIERLDKHDEDLTWIEKPKEIDSEHWHDLTTGAMFFTLQSKAFLLLDRIESHMGNNSEKTTFNLKTDSIEFLATSLKELREQASLFLNSQSHVAEANEFARICQQSDSIKLIKELVNLDGQVLRLVDEQIKPSSAFLGDIMVNEEAQIESAYPFPSNISYRMRNLYLLHLDLTERLDDWLSNNNVSDVDAEQ